jgi:septal ring factor EnvC (AmiA/AmiB activator)
MTKVSAVEKGRINKANYVAYVAELKVTGKKFPLNQFGEVNLSGIAEACGFLRGVFSKNKFMKAQLDADILSIGTEVKEGVDQDSRLAQKAEEKAKEAGRLHKDLDAKVQEINSLREQIDELKKCIRELECRSDEASLSMDELLDSGRRFTL